MEIILYSALLHILQLCTQPTWQWSQGSATNPRQEPGVVSMLAGSPSCITRGCVVWEVWLVWLRFLCPLFPRLVRAPSAPELQGCLHLLLVILSWCTLGNSLLPLTFFVCASFLGRKSLSEANILCEMRNNHENCWALVLKFSSWRLCRIQLGFIPSGQEASVPSWKESSAPWPGQFYLLTSTVTQVLAEENGHEGALGDLPRDSICLPLQSCWHSANHGGENAIWFNLTRHFSISV